MNSRTTVALCAMIAASATPAASSDNAAKVEAFPTARTTWTGQPIVLPQGPVEVKASRVEIAAGGRLPPHKHPFPRYAYVEAGRIRVTNEVTGETAVFTAGAFVVEALDQWHSGEAMDGKPVRLLVVDQTPPGQGNVVAKGP